MTEIFPVRKYSQYKCRSIFCDSDCYNPTCFLKTLIDYPEEQEKIYKELIDLCGEDRNPSVEDRNKLTYTNAFLLEAQRLFTFVPIFPRLECTREVNIGGYKIPKGAIAIVNVYAIHNDPQVYQYPEKFDPSRFLTKEGGSKLETPINFGVGKRVCPGESFQMMETFLFCTTIVKNFRLSYFQSKSYYEILRTRILEILVTPRN